jgi:cysteine desulfuration protein SufE
MPPDGTRPAAGPAAGSVTDRLDAIVSEFADLDGREKLELLLDFAAGLPPLTPEYVARREREDRRVHECQTPVYLWAEAAPDGGRLIAEVAPEAPTVKGFVAILARAVEARPPAEAATLPDDLLDRMGLAPVLGILRSRGLRAILARVRRELVAAGAAGGEGDR